MHIALIQLNYKIGDFEGNYEKIKQAIEKSHHADLLVFSELCLSGYYPRDLISHSSFLEAQTSYFQKVQALTQTYQTAVIVGFLGANQGSGKPYHNSLALLDRGQWLYTYHKRLLPVYNIFDEARHLEPGTKPGYTLFQDKRVGFLICEDAWSHYSEDKSLFHCDPVADLKDKSLDLVICINGSPSNVGKQSQRRHIFSKIAEQCKAPLVFVNQVGANDEIVFDGSSFILDPKGQPLGSLPSFQEAIGVVTLSETHPRLSKDFKPYPSFSDAELFYHHMIIGLKDYMQKCGFQQVVVGASGGIDSALTLALASKALSPSQVIGIAMPTRYSSSESLKDATELCDSLHIRLIIASIEEEFHVALERFKTVFQEKANGLTEQNIQARLRGRLLMSFSNQYGALVLATGNKSELSVGYTTLYGDMTGGLNLLGDLYKTDVYQLAHYFNQQHPDSAIPQAILQKVPTAELAPNQKDSDALPEYEILDPILKWYLEGDLLSKSEKTSLEKVLQKVPASLIQEIHYKICRAEFKRRQAAPLIRVHRRAFGIGRQFPIAANVPEMLF